MLPLEDNTDVRVFPFLAAISHTGPPIFEKPPWVGRR